MSSYIGVRCPVCNKKFVEADDIVVCPVCGAPHHRDCYLKDNQCAFAADHLSGKEWRDPAGQVPPHESRETENRVCGRCGSTNPPDQIFCQVCGSPLSVHPPSSTDEESGQQQRGFPGFQMPDSISMVYGGLSPDEEIDGEKVRDIADYIGSGSAYYLPRFRLLSERKRVVLPCFSAFFFGFFYFFYRKMYAVGTVLLVLSLIGNVPVYIYLWELLPQRLYELGMAAQPEINQAMLEHLLNVGNITQMVNFVISVVISFCSTRYYYGRVIAAVHGIRSKGDEENPQQYSYRMAEAGGTSKVAVAVVGGSIIVFAFVLSVAMVYLRMTRL